MHMMFILPRRNPPCDCALWENRATRASSPWIPGSNRGHKQLIRQEAFPVPSPARSTAELCRRMPTRLSHSDHTPVNTVAALMVSTSKTHFCCHWKHEAIRWSIVLSYCRTSLCGRCGSVEPKSRVVYLFWYLYYIYIYIYYTSSVTHFSQPIIPQNKPGASEILRLWEHILQRN